jgi:hypothetical protein
MSDTVDVPAKEVTPIEDQVLTLNFKVSLINTFLNALNKPLLTDAVTLVSLINEIQAQCAPQLDALAKSDNPPAM